MILIMGTPPRKVHLILRNFSEAPSSERQLMHGEGVRLPMARSRCKPRALEGHIQLVLNFYPYTLNPYTLNTKHSTLNPKPPYNRTSNFNHLDSCL